MAKYGLNRKYITMRDIGWMCKFVCFESGNGSGNGDGNGDGNGEKGLGMWKDKYYWAVRILAIEGLSYGVGDGLDANKLNTIKQDILQFVSKETSNPI